MPERERLLGLIDSLASSCSEHPKFPHISDMHTHTQLHMCWLHTVTHILLITLPLLVMIKVLLSGHRENQPHNDQGDKWSISLQQPYNDNELYKSKVQ